MRVLLTGANTPLGRTLALALAADPAVERVLAVGGDDVGHPPFPDGGRLHWQAVDLSRPRELRSLLFGPARDLGVNVVIHTAIYRAAAAAGRRARALNVDAVRDLLHLAGRHPTIRHVVYRSFAEVYRVNAGEANVLDEEHPLDFSPGSPQWLRDRVEADMAACTYMGRSPFRITVLRLAELYAPDCGGQIFDYLRSRVCFRPLGYDPMLQLLSIGDAARAFILAVHAGKEGIFNIPGKDVLPLSQVIERSGRRGISVPGPLLAPLYGLRRLVVDGQFGYGANAGRFHFGAVIEGGRARRELGYVPERAVDWAGLSPPRLRVSRKAVQH